MLEGKGVMNKASPLQVNADVKVEEPLQGPSRAEAAERVIRFGFNELPTSQPRSIFQLP